MNLREKLELLMQKKDMTRAELARATQIPYTTLDGILKRDKFDNVKFDTLERLCTFFDVDLRYLIKDSISDPNYGKTTHELKTSDPLTSTERENLKKYRALDEHGRELVHLILDKEYARVQDSPAEEEQELTPELIRALIQKEKQRGRLAAFGGFSESVELTDEEREQILKILEKK